MVKDAEAHAEEDRKFHELVNARNQADNLIHATTKSMTELGDKVSDTEKKDIESAIEALKEAMKGDDKARIEEQTQKLAELSGKMAERLYAQKEQAGGKAGAQQEQAQSGAKEDVVDAEFEEVKDDKR